MKVLTWEVVQAQLGSGLHKLPTQNKTSGNHRKHWETAHAQPSWLIQEHNKKNTRKQGERAKADTNNEQAVKWQNGNWISVSTQDSDSQAHSAFRVWERDTYCTSGPLPACFLWIAVCCNTSGVEEKTIITPHPSAKCKRSPQLIYDRDSVHRPPRALPSSRKIPQRDNFQRHSQWRTSLNSLSNTFHLTADQICPKLQKLTISIKL